LWTYATGPGVASDQPGRWQISRLVFRSTLAKRGLSMTTTYSSAHAKHSARHAVDRSAASRFVRLSVRPSPHRRPNSSRNQYCMTDSIFQRDLRHPKPPPLTPRRRRSL